MLFFCTCNIQALLGVVWALGSLAAEPLFAVPLNSYAAWRSTFLLDIISTVFTHGTGPAPLISSPTVSQKVGTSFSHTLRCIGRRGAGAQRWCDGRRRRRAGRGGHTPLQIVSLHPCSPPVNPRGWGPRSASFVLTGRPFHMASPYSYPPHLPLGSPARRPGLHGQTTAKPRIQILLKATLSSCNRHVAPLSAVQRAHHGPHSGLVSS